MEVRARSAITPVAGVRSILRCYPLNLGEGGPKLGQGSTKGVQPILFDA